MTGYLPPHKKEEFPTLGSSKPVTVNNVWNKVESLKEKINHNNLKEEEEKIKQAKQILDYKHLSQSSKLLPKLHKKITDNDDDIDDIDNNEEVVVEEEIIEANESESDSDLEEI